MSHLQFSNPVARRFVLQRDDDATGVSGTGPVALGCCWPDGSAAIWWNTKDTSTAVYGDMGRVERIHGHNGATRIEWVDPAPEPERLVSEFVMHEHATFDDDVRFGEYDEDMP